MTLFCLDCHAEVTDLEGPCACGGRSCAPGPPAPRGCQHEFEPRGRLDPLGLDRPGRRDVLILRCKRCGWETSRDGGD